VPPEPDHPLEARWAADIAAIDAARQAARGDEARLLVQRRIVALHAELEAVRRAADEQLDALRDVALAWKRDVSGGPVSGPRRVDHLGASTFAEKGWARLAQGDAAGAADALSRALELTPEDRQAQAMLGWAHVERGAIDDGLLVLHGVLLREPRHPLARAAVGLACLRKGIHGEAIEHLASAARSGDPKAALYATFWLGQGYASREMYDDAIRQFERAIELGPNLLEAHYALGHAHWAHGDAAAAVTAWTRGADANRFSPWSGRCRAAAERAARGEPPVEVAAPAAS
jgi:tetratricopeptide (TPR) repeat protein